MGTGGYGGGTPWVPSGAKNTQKLHIYIEREITSCFKHTINTSIEGIERETEEMEEIEPDSVDQSSRVFSSIDRSRLSL
ncbi:hypothetical protein LOK49_LG10G00360 [Camellia lanceoleosa]|uniref:Uncharacterized protein n=1 Tax=Camellia lanceoleosa TaxID=1840588 RepID=A0ACC0GDA6_9ERIC|nr:hypothetical protein LOK49_LG10G00360 [Camellia lanceoleosa]